MKSILDPTFRYVNAASTDLRDTFRRVRAEQAAAKAATEAERQAVNARYAEPVNRMRVAK